MNLTTVPGPTPARLTRLPGPSCWFLPSKSRCQMLRDSEGVSLWERWKMHYQRKGYRSRASLERSSRLSAAIFLGTAVTEIYCMIFYAIPFYHGGSGEFTIYCLKVGACFILVNGLANWLCVRFYSSALLESRDRPRAARTLWDAVDCGSPPSNGHAQQPASDYCPVCRLATPPKTHHCRVCNKCILRRDHHCYMLGLCIGYYNQRYFIILSFYVGVACVLGQFYSWQYLRAHAQDPAAWWPMTPLALAQGFLTGEVPLHVALMTCHCYYLWFVGIVAVGYFAWQAQIVRRGVTLYEFKKGISPSHRRSVGENFREVFGDFWALNFIFPAQLLFRLQPATLAE